MSHPRVVHCKRDKYDVYIGRPSAYGNPFVLRAESERDKLIAKYEEWLRAQPELVAQVKRDLRNKTLGCWCAPRACHGEVLARVAMEEP